MKNKNTSIVQIRMPIANAYLLIGRQAILVDTGALGSERTLLKALAAANIQPKEVAMILHTHGHSDHAGSTAALKAITQAPVAIHPADAAMLAAGSNGILKPSRFSAKMWMPFVNRPFPGVQADVLVQPAQSLAQYGIEGQLIHTPGHTQGSISVILESGEAIIGDVLMGGYMGGTFLRGTPRNHWYIDNVEQLRDSIRTLLRCNLKTLYVGHGGPLDVDTVKRRFGN